MEATKYPDEVMVEGHGVTVELIGDDVSVSYDALEFIDENFTESESLQGKYEDWLREFRSDIDRYSQYRTLEMFLRARGFSDRITIRDGDDGNSNLDSSLAMTVWEHENSEASDWIYIQSDGVDAVITLDDDNDTLYEHSGEYAVPVNYAVIPRTQWAEGVLTGEEESAMYHLEGLWDGSWDGHGLRNFADTCGVIEDSLGKDKYGYPTVEVIINEGVEDAELLGGKQVTVLFHGPNNDY